MTRDDVKRLMEQSNFAYEESELDSISQMLTHAEDFVKIVIDADISGMDVTETDTIVPLREDVVKPSLPIEAVLSGAAETFDGYFVAKG